MRHPFGHNVQVQAGQNAQSFNWLDKGLTDKTQEGFYLNDLIKKALRKFG
ncbi:MAG: hypothetical protein M3040_01955 [Bacteroidota bacterium]|nr:hypothetical protein [Bacteroidota bacterium]